MIGKASLLVDTYVGDRFMQGWVDQQCIIMGGSTTISNKGWWEWNA